MAETTPELRSTPDASPPVAEPTAVEPSAKEPTALKPLARPSSNSMAKQPLT